MSSFSGLVIGLSFLFGCVLLAMAAELCYLLWWKRRKEDLEIKHISSPDYTPTHPLSCWKTPNPSKPEKGETESQNQSQTHVQKQDPDMGLGKDLTLKGLGEESVDLELMRLHNLCGPPRFLFTINEETKEDLDTPLSSPHLKLHPLFDSAKFDFDFDSHKLRSSPPPTFKFLRDAEDKLWRRLMQSEGVKKDQESAAKTGEKDGTFGDQKVKIGESQHQISAASKVLPLDSSPSATIDQMGKK